MKIAGVKGMNDVLPGEVGRWQEMEALARELFGLYGYREVRTPVVEQAALFARGVGADTDIVQKEMYAFEDKGEELLCLRPEATAGIVRAFIEHGLHVEGPQKWFCLGPMFRRERPQKGRYRQFHQVDVEALGVAEPAVDVEQIAMLDDFLARLGLRARLKLNSVGDATCRPAYLADLQAWLRSRKGELCLDCNQRMERNPLRVLDCKVPSCQPVLAQAPRLIERLCPACEAHHRAVVAGLDALGVAHQVDARLVRGLDYYVRTAYEFESDALGSQSAVAGGGRYDRLVETLGGPPTPGIGFAIGQERLVMMMAAAGRPVLARVPQIFFVSADEAGAREALVRAGAMRKAGIACDLDARGGKLARQFKQAERVGARYAVVLGGDEVASGRAKLKDLATREETPIALADLVARFAPGRG
jgi:histidyl-tRNA synthetase